MAATVSPVTATGSNAPKSRSLFKLVTIFAGGNVVGTVLHGVSGFLAARLVEPAVFGMFNSFGLVIGYLPFLQIGVFNGLARDLPYYLGKGDKRRAEDLSAAAFGFSALVGGAVMLALCVLAVVFAVRGAWDEASGWVTVAFGGMFYFLCSGYLQSTYRTTGDFVRLTMVTVVEQAASLVLLLAVLAFGFYGLCMRSIASVLVAMVLFWWWRPMPVRPTLKLEPLKRLTKTGVPLFTVSQLNAWWEVANRTLILALMGREALGLYGLAIVGIPAFRILPKAVSQITAPRMAQDFGKDQRVRPLVRSMIRPTAFLFLAMIPITVTAWLVLPHAVRLLLPKYSEGIDATQWALLPAFFTSLNPMIGVLNVAKKNHLYFVCLLLGIGVNAACVFLLTADHLYLEAFPQAMTIGRVCCITAAYAFLAAVWVQEGREPKTIQSAET